MKKIEFKNNEIEKQKQLNFDNKKIKKNKKNNKDNKHNKHNKVGYNSKDLETIKFEEDILIDIKCNGCKSNNIIIPNMTKKTFNSDNDYVIAIPSFKRSDIIQTHTLAVLKKNNIKPEYITIFVANQEENDIYKKAIPSNLYNNIVIGLEGLKNQRNFINDYYPIGKYIVEMDDDIKTIMQLVVKNQSIRNGQGGKGGKGSKGNKSSRESKKSKSYKIVKTVKPIQDLDTFIRRAFEMCIESNIYLWGVYPLINSHFMTHKVTTDLRFIVGPMWGMINRHRKDLKLTVNEKENSERTLQFWVADGAVLRFNNIGIETKYYKNEGGMQAEGKDRKVEALKSVYYLHKMYPKLTKVYLIKKNGMPEIKLNRAA